MFKVIISHSFVSSSCKKKRLIFNHNSNNLTASTIKVLRFSHVFSSEILSFPPAVTSAVSVGSRKNPLQMLSFFFGPFQLFNQPRQSVKGMAGRTRENWKADRDVPIERGQKSQEINREIHTRIPTQMTAMSERLRSGADKELSFAQGKPLLFIDFFILQWMFAAMGISLFGLLFHLTARSLISHFFCRNKE